jgi:hypothetical protein
MRSCHTVRADDRSGAVSQQHRQDLAASNWRKRLAAEQTLAKLRHQRFTLDSALRRLRDAEAADRRSACAGQKIVIPTAEIEEREDHRLGLARSEVKDLALIDLASLVDYLE